MLIIIFPKISNEYLKIFKIKWFSLIFSHARATYGRLF